MKITVKMIEGSQDSINYYTTEIAKNSIELLKAEIVHRRFRKMHTSEDPRITDEVMKSADWSLEHYAKEVDSFTERLFKEEIILAHYTKVIPAAKDIVVDFEKVEDPNPPTAKKEPFNPFSVIPEAKPPKKEKKSPAPKTKLAPPVK